MMDRCAAGIHWGGPLRRAITIKNKNSPSCVQSRAGQGNLQCRANVAQNVSQVLSWNSRFWQTCFGELRAQVFPTFPLSAPKIHCITANSFQSFCCDCPWHWVFVSLQSEGRSRHSTYWTCNCDCLPWLHSIGHVFFPRICLEKYKKRRHGDGRRFCV